MKKIEFDIKKSWERQVLEYFEDVEILCNDYNRAVLRYLGKLGRLLHEDLIDQREYEALNKSLLNVSAALCAVPKTIGEIK